MNDVESAINRLIPAIRDSRDQIEESRQLPDELVEQLSMTGIFRAGVPTALGGDEANPRDLMRLIETLSAADGSVGWCAMLGIGGGITAGYMKEAGAREVFANPETPKALVAEPAGAAIHTADGLRVSGHWRFASGVSHADWIVVGAVVMEDGRPRMTPHGPQIVHVYLPTADIQVHDTWHVSGLCGTGSFDVSCDQVLVPEQRIFSLFDPTGFRPEPLYQMPVLTQVAPAIAVVAIGIARAALDEVTKLADSKMPTMSTACLSEKPVAQVDIARMEARLGAARAFLYETVEAVWQTVLAGGEPTMRQRAMCRAASNYATETATSVAHTASTLAGGTSVYRSSSLQRHARDADVITHHFSQSPHVWEDAGRVLLGMDPTAPLF